MLNVEVSDHPVPCRIILLSLGCTMQVYLPSKHCLTSLVYSSSSLSDLLSRISSTSLRPFNMSAAPSPSRHRRILSIQSHVVSGYVGNKSATFPLQLLGYEVDAINSVQFSNHTGYANGIRGQRLNDVELWDLVEGLLANDIAGEYSHVINGYIGAPSFLEKLAEVIKKMKELNPELTYVCDPVMGDFGPGMYVPESLLPIYRETIVPLADVCVPNQFEAELIVEKKINSESDAFEAMDVFHGMGVETVILSSTELNAEMLVALAR